MGRRFIQQGVEHDHEDRDVAGVTRLSYYSPETIIDRHHLDPATTGGLSAINTLTDAVTNP
ncbi:hypothetical protein [Kribbella rubisoli]|uniref:hypothetical protein n=1 Tax=Kribbella rubisoli TaxID=3075929 RepID=UPI00102AE301|nr:hypothetical protein [Kribbella rubisoli]